MLQTMCKGKIHRATVTQADLNYIGSITIDQDLPEASDIYPYELVHVVNVTNGSRLETYAIAGARGSGVICLNGAGLFKLRRRYCHHHQLCSVQRRRNPLTGTTSRLRRCKQPPY